MAELAVLIGQILNGNDTLLLKGEIGAGKSYFSRKLIQSQQILPEEVPSPTFTLVQTYETSIGEIWHVDLYRLTHADGLIELGLSEAFEDKICLIEWPDLALDMVPENEWQAVSGGKMGQGDFGQAISDYYLSNPTARASALMAELSANAKARKSAPLAAE